MRLLNVLLLSSISLTSFGQKFFENKLGGCALYDSCVDCGNPKVSVKQQELQEFVNSLAEDEKLGVSQKRFEFELYIDTSGKGCPISYRGEITSKTAIEIA